MSNANRERSFKARREEDDPDDNYLSLRIMDTSNVLTEAELKELKFIVQMSKTAKILFAGLIGAVSLFGVSTVLDWASRLNKM